jgi:hypothetical protein
MTCKYCKDAGVEAGFELTANEARKVLMALSNVEWAVLHGHDMVYLMNRLMDRYPDVFGPGHD